MSLTRREVLGISIFGTAAALTGCDKPTSVSRPPEAAPKEQFTAATLQQLGRELAAWRMADGQPITNLPLVGDTAKLLQGQVDPRQSLFPILSLPIRYQQVAETQGGVFTISPFWSTIDTRKTKISFPTGENFTVGWLSSETYLTIGLSSAVYSSTVRKCIAAKEAEHLLSIGNYCRLYLDEKNKQGITVEFINPEHVPTTLQEEAISKALALNEQETILGSKNDPNFKSDFLEWMDTGAHLRLGGILFANWVSGELASNNLIPETESWFILGNTYVGFLAKKGLIKREDLNNRKSRWVWTTGRPPEINNPQFLQLVKEIEDIKKRVVSKEVIS